MERKIAILKAKRQVWENEIDMIDEGFVYDFPAYVPETVAMFDDKEAAIEKLKEYSSRLTRDTKTGELEYEEYWVQEVFFDEECGDVGEVFACTPKNIEIVKI